MADELTAWTVAAETKEWVGPISVTADGDATTEFEVTLTAPGARPADWSEPTVLETQRGILIGDGTDYPLTAGRKYTVWIRYTDDPEAPVYRIGTVKAY
jgi:hypothetical protein